jgi:hypothetical protein
VKLKNELCSNFLQTGYCKYQDKCQFAHGVQELRQHQEANNKYKTKKCIAYFDKASCAYGDRCNFQHAREDTSPRLEWKKARANFREVFWHARARRGPFASF